MRHENDNSFLLANAMGVEFVGEQDNVGGIELGRNEIVKFSCDKTPAFQHGLMTDRRW